MDIANNFQFWRFHHMKTVERIIGHKPGTGGSSGVAFLRKALEIEFFPELDQGNVTVEVELPQGYNLQETARLIESIEGRVVDHSEVVHILTTLGSLSSLDRGTNMAKINIKLVDADERDLNSRQLANLFIRDLSDIPNAKIRVSAISGAGTTAR